MFRSVDDGYAVDLEFTIEELSTKAILLDGFTDVFHLCPIDSDLWFTIFIRNTCFDFNEMQFVFFHANNIKFTSSMQVPIMVKNLVTIFAEI